MEDVEVLKFGEISPSDLREILSLREGYFRDIYAGRELDDEATSVALDALVRLNNESGGDFWCCVVRNEGVIVGIGFLVVQNNLPSVSLRCDRKGLINGVYVLPRFRGLGFGGRVIRRLVCLASGLGLEVVELFSEDGAVELYANIGFKNFEAKNPMRGYVSEIVDRGFGSA